MQGEQQVNGGSSSSGDMPRMPFEWYTSGRAFLGGSERSDSWLDEVHQARQAAAAAAVGAPAAAAAAAAKIHEMKVSSGSDSVSSMTRTTLPQLICKYCPLLDVKLMALYSDRNKLYDHMIREHPLLPKNIAEAAAAAAEAVDFKQALNIGREEKQQSLQPSEDQLHVSKKNSGSGRALATERPVMLMQCGHPRSDGESWDCWECHQEEQRIGAKGGKGGSGRSKDSQDLQFNPQSQCIISAHQHLQKNLKNIIEAYYLPDPKHPPHPYIPNFRSELGFYIQTIMKSTAHSRGP